MKQDLIIAKIILMVILSKARDVMPSNPARKEKEPVGLVLSNKDNCFLP
jgi:hypothetical protein